MPAQVTTQWLVPPRNREFEKQVSEATGVHPLVAALLHNRDIKTLDEVRTFLSPSVDDLLSPATLPDIQPAIDRIVAAIGNKERILVHGDYDVDGVTACALLTRFLSTLGVNVSYYIPHRIKDQYGLSREAIQRAVAAGITLIIAVDCGVNALEPIAVARDAGADVIVIDHHEPGPELPHGACIIDPKRSDSQYPESELAAVGLTFKVASALCAELGLSQRSLQRAFLDLVALGTIADMVPLRGENRVLTALGLKLLPHTRKTGLRSLLDICRLDSTLSASDIAYRLAPRLNAVGRMGDASDALALLLTNDADEGRRKALYLDSINRERQHEQERVYLNALVMLDEQEELREAPVLVLASADWHVGVVGIVASKIVERYRRPAILLVQEGTEARGSARSVEGFDIAWALRQCDDLLLHHGGHVAAAGLTMSTENLTAFQQRMNQLAIETIGTEASRRVIKADAEVELSEVDHNLAEGLRDLEPCGQGNPEPLFICRNVEVVDCRRVGASEHHLKLVVAANGSHWECIGFGMGSEADWISPGQAVDLCFAPEINQYQGREELQLRLEAVRPSGQD